LALEQWVEDGGVLVAMRPAGALLPLLGLRAAATHLVFNTYIVPSDRLAPSRGIVQRPMQVHSGARLYEVLGERGAATTVAHLQTSREGAPQHPAVTMRQHGKGYAIAFAFDLAESVVLIRQGNPRWANMERDGSRPRRPNDLFYPDHLDLELIGVPQADEQQRLLVNLITWAGICAPAEVLVLARRKARRTRHGGR
jgi:hypothetical protein